MPGCRTAPEGRRQLANAAGTLFLGFVIVAIGLAFAVDWNATTPFEVKLEGNVIGTVAPQDTVELPIDAGQHTPRLGSGRQISQKRTFEATDSQTITFGCHGAAIWPIYLASLIKPDLAISLKREERTYSPGGAFGTSPITNG